MTKKPKTTQPRGIVQIHFEIALDELGDFLFWYQNEVPLDGYQDRVVQAKLFLPSQEIDLA